MAEVVRVRAEVLARLTEEAQRAPAEECCGLLGGRDGVITDIFPTRNALASPTAYEVAPAELFAVFRRMREEGLEHMGIYHSHPTGDNAPSPRDIERAYYPEAVYFIVSPQPTPPRPIRAFFIRDGRVAELAIESIREPSSG